MPKLRLKIIACDVLNREISFLCSQSSCFCDVTFLHQGLHDTPDKLREQLQEEINRTNRGFPYNYYNTAPDFDYIIIGYGLCSNGIIGMVSDRIPMVVPRGHDCTTLLLGSKKKYSEYFSNHPGTYWFSTGWIERGWQPSELKYNVVFQEYVKKYGEDNAEYLMDMEQSWMKDYKNAAFIHWDTMPDSDYYRSFTQESARYFNWNFLEFEGDSGLMKRILNGEFNHSEVLIVPPGKRIVQSYDENIIKYE